MSDEREELRQLIREAHECIRGIREAMRATETMFAQKRRELERLFADESKPLFEANLTALSKKMEEHIEHLTRDLRDSVQAVEHEAVRRLDRIREQVERVQSGVKVTKGTNQSLTTVDLERISRNIRRPR